MLLCVCMFGVLMLRFHDEDVIIFSLSGHELYCDHTSSSATSVFVFLHLLLLYVMELIKRYMPAFTTWCEFVSLCVYMYLCVCVCARIV